MRFRPLLLAALTLPLAFALLVALAPDSGRTSERAELWTGVLSGEFTPDETAVDDCAGLPGYQQSACYIQAFGNIAYREGGAATMELLMGVSAESSDTLNDCHVVAHMIGVASYHGHNKNFAAALADGDPQCSGGYYHGAVAGEIATMPVTGPEELGSRAAASCNAASSGLLLIECIHGIGHAAEHVYEYDIATSLRSCDAVESTLAELGATPTDLSAAYNTCTQGVFMENRQVEGGESGKWFRAEDPLYPCLEFSEKAGRACWDLVPGKIQQREGETTVELQARRYEACLSAKKYAGWYDSCLVHARMTILSTDINTLSSVEVMQSCRLDPEGTEPCFYAIGFEATNLWSSVSRSKSLCAGAGTDEDRRSCARGIGAALRGTLLPVGGCDELDVPLLVDICREGYRERVSY